MLGTELIDDLGLNKVGILVFIDQDLPEAPAVFFGHPRMLREQPVEVDQEIVKIETI